jgi:hypothetical protein
VADAADENCKHIDRSKALLHSGHVQKRIARLRDIERVPKVMKRHLTTNVKRKCLVQRIRHIKNDSAFSRAHDNNGCPVDVECNKRVTPKNRTIKKKTKQPRSSTTADHKRRLQRPATFIAATLPIKSSDKQQETLQLLSVDFQRVDEVQIDKHVEYV